MMKHNRRQHKSSLNWKHRENRLLKIRLKERYKRSRGTCRSDLPGEIVSESGCPNREGRSRLILSKDSDVDINCHLNYLPGLNRTMVCYFVLHFHFF